MGYGRRGLFVFVLMMVVAVGLVQVLPVLPPHPQTMTAVFAATCGLQLLAAIDALRLSPRPARVLGVLVRLAGLVVLMVAYVVVMQRVLPHLAGRTYYIPSESMLPTLEVNDYIAVSLLQRDPRRGDVMVFRPPAETYTGDKNELVKRVVALEGQVVELRDGALWVDGQRQQEPYLKEPMNTSFPEFQRLKIPAGSVFMMGDNRNNSHDSRFFGPVPKANLVGRAVWIFMSDNPAHVGKALH